MLTFPPDFSFVIQIVSFLLLLAALKRLAFEPVLHVLDERAARTQGALAQAEQLTAQAHGAEEKYATSLRYVRQQVLVEAESARKRAQDEQRRELTSARAAADAELATLRTDIAAQVTRAQATLANEARTIGALMAERVSGRRLA
jgi:F-type H+-transporting ATPase subunit b